MFNSAFAQNNSNQAAFNSPFNQQTQDVNRFAFNNSNNHNVFKNNSTHQQHSSGRNHFNSHRRDGNQHFGGNPLSDLDKAISETMPDSSFKKRERDPHFSENQQYAHHKKPIRNNNQTYSNPQNTAFGNSNNAGFGGRNNAGPGSNNNAAFGGNRKAAFGGNNNTGFSGRNNAGPGSNNNAFGGNRKTAFGSNRNTAFGGNRNAAFNNNRNAAFGGNSNNAFGGNQDSAFGGNSNNNAAFGGNHNTALAGSSNTAFGNTGPNFFNNSNSAFGNASKPSDSKQSVFSGNNSSFEFDEAAFERAIEETSGNSIGLENAAFDNAGARASFGATNKTTFHGTNKPAFGANKKATFIGNNKPAFGDANKPTFGGANKPPFGDANKPAFGGANKPAFGDANKPAFGGANKPAFGDTNKPAASSSKKFGFVDRDEPAFVRSTRPALTDDNTNTFISSSKPPTLSAAKKLTPSGFDNKSKKGTGIVGFGGPLMSDDDVSPSTPQQRAANRAQRFGNTAKSIVYDQLKKSRISERKEAIADGLIPDPENPTRLEDAIDFRGTCETKCPEFEMIEREIQNSLDSLEMEESGVADPEKVVKAYRRSAAGNEQPLPSDVRTPQALINTLDYLINEVLESYPLPRCHAFIRDRTRSIRQDFTLQNIRDIDAVHVHERIARFHILCLHEMCELEESKFSEQQETEQLRKVLLSLIEFYDDLREEDIETENEAEFRAYYIITHIRDQDVARHAQTLPISIFQNPYIQKALEFHALAQRNNEIMETSSRRNKPENVEASMNFYSKFFNMIGDEDTPFLMACLLETHFADVRKGALKAMNVSYMLKAGGVPANYICDVLKYDDISQLLQEAHHYGIIIDNSLDEPTLCFGQKHYKHKVPVFLEPLSSLRQKKSMILVEPKKKGMTFKQIINNDEVQVHKTISNVPDQKEKQLLLETTRAAAAAAEALLEEERQKMNALIRKKEIEAQMKAEKQREEERKKREALEKEIARIEAENKRKEEEILQKKLRQEEELKKEQLRKQAQELEVEQMRRKALLSRLFNRTVNNLIDEVLTEEVKVTTVRVKRRRRILNQYTTPWVRRVKNKIIQRNQKALDKQRAHGFSKYIITHNPYSSLNEKFMFQTPEHATPDGVKQRVEYALTAEECALEVAAEGSQSVWQTHNFVEDIYPAIRDKIADLKACDEDAENCWQLFISSPDTSSDTAKWFTKKFGLDEDSYTHTSKFVNLELIERIVTPESSIGAKWAYEVGALVFDLPASEFNKTPEEMQAYWTESKKRLNGLTQKILKYTSKKIPVVFCYFPDATDVQVTLQEIPVYLDLSTNEVISDYHLLIMNPNTVATRIVDEVRWLANQSRTPLVTR